MNYQYSIEDLATCCKVSKQSIYNLINKNKEFVKENSKKQGRKVKYNQAILDLFLDYYGKLSEEPETAEHQDPPPQEPEEIQEDAPEAPGRPEEQEEASPSVEALKAEIEALEAEVKDLQAKYDKCEAERQMLLQQNAVMVMVLKQEKDEKQMLLPAPKRSFTQRILGLFSGKQD